MQRARGPCIDARDAPLLFRPCTRDGERDEDGLDLSNALGASAEAARAVAEMMKKVTAAFDGSRLSSDGGVMLLCEAERRLGIAARLAGLFRTIGTARA
jgi:hypothetical protein